MLRRFPATGRVPFPLPPKRERPRSGIARAPKRIWLRHRRFVKSHHCCVPGCQSLAVDLAHLRSVAEGSGTSLKPFDWFTVPLCRNHHLQEEAAGPDAFGDRHGIDLWAIARELMRRSPDMQMRLALMMTEEQDPPHEKQRPAASGGLAGTCPETSSSLGRNTAEVGQSAYSGNRDVTAGRDRQPFRLAGVTSRLCRLLPIQGFVS